jgi:flagellar biosynthesis chaperone FliJ
MKKLLILIRKSREARKDAAAGRLAAAQQGVGRAVANSKQKLSDLIQAKSEYDHLLATNGAGLLPDWRNSVLPGVLTLLELRARATQMAHRELMAQRAVVADCRRALTLCEKALLRTDELQAILKDEQRERERLAEQDVDDDLAIARRPSTESLAWT